VKFLSECIDVTDEFHTKTWYYYNLRIIYHAQLFHNACLFKIDTRSKNTIGKKPVFAPIKLFLILHPSGENMSTLNLYCAFIFCIIKERNCYPFVYDNLLSWNITYFILWNDLKLSVGTIFYGQTIRWKEFSKKFQQRKCHLIQNNAM